MQFKIKPLKMFSKRHLVVGPLMLLIIHLIILSNFTGLFGMSSVSASRHYGILGQPAPELNLTGWIDGQGKQTAPVKINHYQGRVIYLYFFQDW